MDVVSMEAEEPDEAQIRLAHAEEDLRTAARYYGACVAYVPGDLGVDALTQRAEARRDLLRAAVAWAALEVGEGVDEEPIE
jgi:hypothetical protein